MKINDFSSQLNQYHHLLGWNWQEDATDTPIFIKKTLNLLNMSENKISELFGLPDQQCKICKKTLTYPNEFIHYVDTSHLLSEEEDVNAKTLMDILMKENRINKCCKENISFKDSIQKCIILELSHPVPINLTKLEALQGRKLILSSSVSQEVINGTISYCSNFYHQKQAFYQNSKGDICEADLRNKKIKILSFLLSNEEEN